jgi:hypothetical protein
VLEDPGWARFDRLVELFERAHIELACRRVAGPRWGDDLTEAVRVIYGQKLKENAVFRDRAWQLALAASDVGTRSARRRVVDLCDTLCDTFGYRVQLR